MKAILAAACLLVTPLSFASDYHHALSVGAGIGYTSISSDDNVTDNIPLHYDLAYRYQFSSEWGLEVGYQDVFVNNIIIIGNQMDNVDSFRAAALYTLPLSQRNSLVFKLGANQYRLKFTDTDDNGRKYTDDGTGLLAGLGWRMEFASGMDLGLTYHYQAMDLLDTHTFTFNLGYRF
ncbi:porin family protein [Shewanella psychrotolerans]|uniref:porin family protein n=1 Tax=Shewanella psychrotolerans TaxID=2864206 RepID=UPI001C656215|nr:porin family protein [Shewanella psychrotolerans]QYK01397.1 porin family protein [Shewanella psychrotolerans]